MTDRQVSRLCKAFANNSSANIKLSKTVQSIGFLGRLLGPIMRVGLPLMKNGLKPLAKIVLIPLRLTAAVSTTHAAIQKKIHGPGIITLIISNKNS